MKLVVGADQAQIERVTALANRVSLNLETPCGATLTQIAPEKDLSRSMQDLAKVRGLSSGWKNNDIGARLMAALADAKPLEGDELPKREPSRPGLTKDAALVSDLLKLLLKIRAKEAGVACETVHASDFPAEGIIATAKDKGCDLIVMASHGRRGLSKLILGSQATRVLALSTVPVLICR